jgi:hypothetical protein
VTRFGTAAVTRSLALPAKVRVAEVPGFETFIGTDGPLTVTVQHLAGAPLLAAAGEATVGNQRVKLTAAISVTTIKGNVGRALRFETPSKDARRPVRMIDTATPFVLVSRY